MEESKTQGQLKRLALLNPQVEEFSTDTLTRAFLGWLLLSYRSVAELHTFKKD